MRARATVFFVAVFLTACAGQDIDASRCAGAVLRAAQDVAAECLIPDQEACELPDADGDGDGGES